MNNIVPNHLSNKLELGYNKKHFYLTDRVVLYRLLPGIVFGFLLFLLGIYECLNAFRFGGEELIPSDTAKISVSSVEVYFFDLCFIIVGLGTFISNVLFYIRYNKYKLNKGVVTIIKRPVFGEKITIDEDLKNYSGVRFRVEFLQSGFLLKNRYIIELYHKNPEKIVPLYISTSDKDIRKKWKQYAKSFKLPAMINTDTGLKSIELKDLNKSVSALYKAGLIKDNYDDYDTLPSAITFVRKKDKIVLKIKKIVWDAYNLLAWAVVLMASSLFLLLWANFDHIEKKWGLPLYSLSFIGVILIAVIVQILFRKEKLVLKKHKIVETHKYLLFSTKHNEIMKNDIEAIEVTENPATGRYFVSIISEDNLITFGSKMAISDLLWIKRFLIHEIVKS